jgi:hypothetical protein
MVHSHIVYCINIYSCATTTNLDKIRLKQKEAIRIITNSQYRAHTIPLFADMSILPLDQLIKYHSLKFMHSFSFNNLPFSFSEMWIKNRARNQNLNLNLRNAEDLFVPPHKLATLKRMPLFNFPRLWNQENNSKNNPVLHQYLKSVKRALFSTLNR